MENLAKLQDVATYMHLEPAEETLLHTQSKQVAPCGQVIPSDPVPASKTNRVDITYAQMPNGRKMPMLKTMLTSACERNCYYCPFRAGRNYRRNTFTPEEMAKTFIDIYRAGMVEGLFLSSGVIGGGIKTQDKLIDTADILRNKYQFHGYLHLKVMPGVEKDQVARAMQLASRLSVNLEAPNDQRLRALAPRKHFISELLQPLKWIEEIRQSESGQLGWNGRWPASATQFVVGGTDENDLELLTTADYLHKQLRLRRVYFSAFNPIRDTPLENRPAENPMRQHRLYQASFLFRDYNFDLEEMPFLENGNLPLDTDPKLAWAQVNLLYDPVEVNRATREELLRVPGIGPKGAAAILNARRRGSLQDVRHLHQIGVRTKRLKPYVLLDGKRPSYQPRLF